MNAYLERLIEDVRVIELRHNTGTRWESGLFDHLDPLLAAIRRRRDAGNLYVTLNRPGDIPVSNDMRSRALKDSDIAMITRIPFDLDPVRQAGTASTDAELQAAIEARGLLVNLLASHGWPRPALGMSGNGAHALYRARVEASPGWRQATGVIYAALRVQLQEEFDRLGVVFDTTVRNPARIWRLYGTINRKGDPTPERPHREATIDIPRSGWQPVTLKTLRNTYRAMRPLIVRERPAPLRRRGQVQGGGDYSTLDIVAWFAAHDSYRRPLNDGKHAVRCPWAGEHTTIAANGTDTVVWEVGAGGWPSFHCSHAHCEGRSLRDVLAAWDDADRFCGQEYRRG